MSSFLMERPVNTEAAADDAWMAALATHAAGGKVFKAERPQRDFQAGIIGGDPVDTPEYRTWAEDTRARRAYNIMVAAQLAVAYEATQTESVTAPELHEIAQATLNEEATLAMNYPEVPLR